MQDEYVNQCVKEKVPIQDEISKWECQANVYKEDDNICQENVHMWPVEPVKESNHMQSVTRSSNTKSLESACDKNCQAIRCHDKICQSNVCSDKNCQDTRFMQPEMNMWSKKLLSRSKKKHVPLCNDKNCQSTRCYNKQDQVKFVCSEKNCPETQNINM